MLKLLMIVNFSTPNKLNHSTYFFKHIEYLPKNSKTKEIKFLSLEYREQGVEKWKNKQQLQQGGGVHLRSNFLIIGSL